MSAVSANNKSKWSDAATLDVRLLGTVDFESALFLQERLVYEISGRDDAFGGLFLCEHPPLITVGRTGSRAHLLLEQKELAARRLEVRWLNRGGGCLLHAPGQLAVYPVVPLARLGLGLAEYRSRLIASVLDVCSELNVPAQAIAADAGVAGRNGQFAFIGVSVKRWVAYHGLFINVRPLMSMQKVISCGGTGRPTTSLEALRGRATPMPVVRESLVRNLARRLGYPQYQIYTGHPLLKRTRRADNVYA